MQVGSGKRQLHRPQAFQAFASAGSASGRLSGNGPESSITGTLKDTLLDTSTELGAKRVLGLFLSGMAAAVAGRWVWKGLFSRGKAQAQKAFEIAGTGIMKNKQGVQNELNIAQSFADPLSSIYMLAFHDPAQRKALMAYAGSGALGYVAGSFFQGVQETWVRREETKIRARLLNRIQDVFKQSIRTKLGFDNGLKERTQKRIYQMLLKHRVPNAHGLVVDQLLVEPLLINRNYVYQPTHRKVVFGASKADNAPLELAEPEKSASRRWMEIGVFTAGALAGTTLQGFLNLFTTKNATASHKGKTIIYKTIHVKDREGWWILATKSRRNFLVFLGFSAMAFGAKLGKLLIDGLREIEVTQVNAKTEYLYQKHNWLSLDPDFHRIAETESLENELARLEQDMNHLKSSPKLLRQRIKGILGNIGRNSAPKYFPMTPGVNLVEARG